MKSLFILMIIVCSLPVAFGQTANDVQEFRINTSNLSSFRLHNMNGAVNVQGIDGKMATLKVKRKLMSASSSRIEEAKESITFDSVRIDDRIYFFMSHPDQNFEIDEQGDGQYNSCCNRSNDRYYVKVNYEFEIDLQVPKQMELQVSTHRKNLTVKDIHGNLVAKNHHNNLFAENLGGNVTLRSHHGDIKASFIRNPTEACSYSTHHGDIRIGFQHDLAASVFLKSRKGEFFTDFDWTPEVLAVAKGGSKNGTKYIINNRTAIRIGNGGPEQDFKTWHGDIYLVTANQ